MRYNCSAFATEKDKNIRAFLEYVKTQNATDDWTEKLEKRVKQIKREQNFGSDYMTYQMHIKEWLREGKAEGIAIGERRGAHDKAVETARALCSLGVNTVEQISQVTGLPLAEIEQLQNTTTQA